MIVKVEQFPYDYYQKHESMESYEITEFNSRNDLKIEISRKNSMLMLKMIFTFKYLCSWFQYPVVRLKVEQFPYDHFSKHKLKDFYETSEFNSINDRKSE